VVGGGTKRGGEGIGGGEGEGEGLGSGRILLYPPDSVLFSVWVKAHVKKYRSKKNS
jgi:hypothetical protein